MKNLWIIIFFLSLLTSCDYHYQKQIGENYFIRCIENRNRMNIGFGATDTSEGLISSTVFEVFYDDEYILVKRHPITKGKEVTEYYIIKKVKFGVAKASKNMYGPLTLK